MVTNLQHFLELPLDAPGPARRLAKQLGDLVSAATAGDAGTAWESALPCRRRPGHRACPGRMVLHRHFDVSIPIGWQCSGCGDRGRISNWADSPFDLRRRRLARAEPVHQILIPTDVAATLRELHLLDVDSQRLVFRIHPHATGKVVLPATEDGLEELIGSLAAEANHESNRPRQRRLDRAFEALNGAAGSNGA
ncbi:hypothetical protein [Ornithinimicrobium cerasi]|uniref:Uncharacterized protein n=1 Tax=Ornithinimicrobium cerasi TaxID=2248773 RepID=A0A285VPX8_9MICO|nr:hypothetical protein [Ornithinimicrobium cerasi]SOC56105.1 hypothetical protein SAMN05421879_106206 [Ornithinimicrobium cerasi]